MKNNKHILSDGKGNYMLFDRNGEMRACVNSYEIAVEVARRLGVSAEVEAA